MSKSSRRRRRRARWLSLARRSGFRAHATTWPRRFWTRELVERWEAIRAQLALEEWDFD